MDDETKAEIARLERLIADLGDPETWKHRKNLKGNSAAKLAYEMRLRQLKEGHRQQ